MILLYIWSCYSVHKQGIPLTSKYDISFDEERMELCINSNMQYITNFWAKNVSDVIAIVGENGSGKTRLIEDIMNNISALYTDLEKQINWHAHIYIIEDIEGIKIYVSPQYTNIKVKCNKYYQLLDILNATFLDTYRVAYFANTLSLSNYCREYNGIIFNASIGGNINNSYTSKLHYGHIDEDKDLIRNYFETELEKMLNFLFYSDVNKLDIPFYIPRSVDIKLDSIQCLSDRIEEVLNRWGDKKIDQQGEIIINLLYERIKVITLEIPCAWFYLLLLYITMSAMTETLGILKTVKDVSDLLHYVIKEIKTNDLYNHMTSLLHICKTKCKQTELFKNMCKYEIYLEWLIDNSSFWERTFISGNAYTIDLTDKESQSYLIQLLQYYNSTNAIFPYFTFDFGLSTGEFNFLNNFANVHLALSAKMTDSVREYDCKDILLIFDEADLSMHPRWQQKYVDWIVRFASSCAPNCNIQILIATHSPIMLSDFPKNNVLYLQKDDNGESTLQKRDIKTFGNNIHTLFLDSFFLSNEGTMGAFAERKITELITLLNKNGLSVKKNNAEQLLKEINYIGDDFIRNRLLNLYQLKVAQDESPRPETTEQEKSVTDNVIGMLREQIRQLENTISELERMKCD